MFISLIPKVRTKLRRSDMLKLPRHIGLESKVIPQRSENSTSMTTKSLRADKLSIRRGEIRNREARKAQIFLKNPQKY